jgi:Tfp pilus assembly protein PilV
MIRHNTQSGFGIIEVALVTAVVAVVGFGGWAVYVEHYENEYANYKHDSGRNSR